MAYTKQNWKNLPQTSTPITAERLNHIEAGISSAANDEIEATRLPIAEDFERGVLTKVEIASIAQEAANEAIGDNPDVIVGANAAVDAAALRKHYSKTETLFDVEAVASFGPVKVNENNELTEDTGPALARAMTHIDPYMATGFRSRDAFFNVVPNTELNSDGSIHNRVVGDILGRAYWVPPTYSMRPLETSVLNSIKAKFLLSAANGYTWFVNFYPGTGDIPKFRNRYGLTTDASKPYQNGSTEQSLRVVAQLAYIWGVCARWGVQLGLTPTQIANYKAACIRAGGSLALNHRATNFSGEPTTANAYDIAIQPAWGGQDVWTYGKPRIASWWQSALWAGQAARGLQLVWSDVPTSKQNAAIAMVAAEADRFNNIPPNMWFDGRATQFFMGDTKSEEDAWTSLLLGVAAALNPTAPNAPIWRTQANRYMFASQTNQADHDLRRIVSGMDPRTFGGFNRRPDQFTVNGGADNGVGELKFNYCVASYMNAAFLSPVYTEQGWEVPRAFFHNLDGLYQNVQTVPVVAGDSGFETTRVLYQPDYTIAYPHNNDVDGMYLPIATDALVYMLGLPDTGWMKQPMTWATGHLSVMPLSDTNYYDNAWDSTGFTLGPIMEMHYTQDSIKIGKN